MSFRTSMTMTPRRPAPADRPPRRVRLCGEMDRLAAPSPGPVEEDPDRTEALCEAVRGAVAQALTEKQRQVIELYFFEGRSQGEIAGLLGVTQQVVQKRIYGTPRAGRLVGGALGRLRVALGPLAMERGWARP